MNVKLRILTKKLEPERARARIAIDRKRGPPNKTLREGNIP